MGAVGTAAWSLGVRDVAAGAARSFEEVAGRAAWSLGGMAGRAAWRRLEALGQVGAWLVLEQMLTGQGLAGRKQAGLEPVWRLGKLELTPEPV